MSRAHYLDRIRSTYGTVVPSEDVYIYLAGTTDAAIVYESLTEGDPIIAAPQVQSDVNGLVDFYLDSSYGVDQLFDIVVDDIKYSNLTIISGSGDMQKATYDANDDGVVDETELFDGGGYV